MSTIAINLCGSLEELAKEVAEKVSQRTGSAIASATDLPAFVLKSLLPAITTSDFLQPPATADAQQISAETALALGLLLLGKDFASAPVCDQIITSTTSEGDKEARTRLLVQVYHATKPGPQRYAAFKRVVEFAGQASAITSSLTVPAVEQLARAWKCTAEESRALLLAVADSSPQQLQQPALLAYLASAGSEQADVQRVRQAVINAIREPTARATTAAALAQAVQRLAKEDAQLHELATVVCLSSSSSSSLAQYQAFSKAHPAYEQSVGLNPDKTLEKMRLVALGGLGGEQLAYAQVASALQITETEVERWVIRAIGLKLVEAKMDQASRTVTVTQCCTTNSGAASSSASSSSQVKQLQDKLAKWKAALARQQQPVAVAVE